MPSIKISKISEIDFLTVDVNEDQFILPDGRTYRFSLLECDDCRAGGTVLESLDEPKKFVCVLCERELALRSFKNDFIPPTGDSFEFLLPASLSQEELQDWFAHYKESRLLEEKVRQRILESGKG